jgi:hypothetical protein
MLKVYIKPLLSKSVLKKKLDRLLTRRLKYNLGRAGLKKIREHQKNYGKNGNSIRKSVSFTIGKSSITFHLNAIGSYHNYGVRKHKMKYLQKATRPIPIKDKNTGEIIFRWASKKSMRKKGSWTHLGLPKTKFFEKGVEDLKKDFRKKLKSEFKKYMSKK